MPTPPAPTALSLPYIASRRFREKTTVFNVDGRAVCPWAPPDSRWSSRTGRLLPPRRPLHARLPGPGTWFCPQAPVRNTHSAPVPRRGDAVSDAPLRQDPSSTLVSQHLLSTTYDSCHFIFTGEITSLTPVSRPWLRTWEGGDGPAPALGTSAMPGGQEALDKYLLTEQHGVPALSQMPQGTGS